MCKVTHRTDTIRSFNRWKAGLGNNVDIKKLGLLDRVIKLIRSDSLVQLTMSYPSPGITRTNDLELPLLRDTITKQMLNGNNDLVFKTDRYLTPETRNRVKIRGVFRQYTQSGADSTLHGHIHINLHNIGKDIDTLIATLIHEYVHSTTIHDPSRDVANKGYLHSIEQPDGTVLISSPEEYLAYTVERLMRRRLGLHRRHEPNVRIMRFNEHEYWRAQIKEQYNNLCRELNR